MIQTVGWILLLVAAYMADPVLVNATTTPKEQSIRRLDEMQGSSFLQTPRAIQFTCNKCGLTAFDSSRSVRCHQRFNCRGPNASNEAPAGYDAADLISPDADQCVKRQRTISSKEEQFASNLKHYKLSTISTFRHRRNLGDATVTAVTEFCSGMLSRVRAELERRATAMMNAFTSISFADMISSIFEIANSVTTTYMDKKARTEKLPSIEPQKRLLGIRKTTHTCSDGRKVHSEIHDYCYDQPADLTVQRFLRLNPDILADLLREEAPFNGTISDLQHGSVYRQHPLTPKPGESSSSLHLATLFYYDGVGVNNPIGAFHNLHNLGICYFVVVQISKEHRLSLHNIFPVTVAELSAYQHWPASHLVYGRPDEPINSTSFGMFLKRMQHGQIMSLPDVAVPNGYSDIMVTASCIGITADTPAAAWLTGFNQSYAPEVKSICRLCNCTQVPQPGSGLLYPSKRANSFLPWTRAGAQVWKLRTAEDIDELRAKCAKLSPTAANKLMQQHGIRTFHHAFADVPYFDPTWAPMGLMHVEFEGNLKVHIAAFIYMACSVLKRSDGQPWATLDAVNAAISEYSWPADRSDRPSGFHHSVTKGTKDNTPVPAATINWTASQVMHFAMHAVHILEPFVPSDQRQHRVWVCFRLHMQYVELLLHDSFDLTKIALLDRLIYAQQTLFLQIPQYSELWKPKNHYAQHFPVDILRFGPPVMYWELKFEMRHQALKNYAKRSNFVNVAYTVLQQADLKEALDLTEGKLLDFLQPELIDTVAEKCDPGSSAIIDELFSAGTIPLQQSVWVNWAYGLKITHRRTISRSSWLLIKTVFEKYASLARVQEVFSLGDKPDDPEDVIFLRYLCFPRSLLVPDYEKGGWVANERKVVEQEGCQVKTIAYANLQIQFLHLTRGLTPAASKNIADDETVNGTAFADDDSSAACDDEKLLHFVAL